MLIELNKIHALDLKAIAQVYAQSIEREYHKDECVFFEDLRLFFDCNNAVMAAWVCSEAVVAAVRLEPYRDGYLISCLETAPQHRRKGYAAALLKGVFEKYTGVFYAHVHKGNQASLALHKKLGFTIHQDHAVYVDGSVYTSSFTLKR